MIVENDRNKTDEATLGGEVNEKRIIKKTKINLFGRLLRHNRFIAIRQK